MRKRFVTVWSKANGRHGIYIPVGLFMSDVKLNPFPQGTALCGLCVQ